MRVKNGTYPHKDRRVNAADANPAILKRVFHPRCTTRRITADIIIVVV